MTQEQLAMQLEIPSSNLRRWLKQNKYETSPLDETAIKTAIEYFKIRADDNVQQLTLNKLCKKCPYKFISDYECCKSGVQKRCLHYKKAREERRKVMPGFHV